MRKLALPLCAGILTTGVVLWLAGMEAAGGEEAKARTPHELLKVSFKRPAVRATLAQAIADLSKLADVKIVVDWQGLIETGVKPEAGVSLPATEATLEKLLEQTLVAVAAKGRPLAWCMVDGSVCVTTQARVLHRDRLIVAADNTVASRPAEARGAPPPAAGAAGGRDFRFDKTPLSDVVTFLQSVSGVNFHVNYTALETSGVDKNTPVTLDVSGVTVAKVLDLITESLSGGKGRYDSIYWIVDDDIVKITTGTALDATVQTRVYETGDLLMGVPNMQGPRLNLSLQTGNTTANTTNNQIFTTVDNQSTTLTPAVTKEDMQAKLIGIIRKSIGEDMWEPQGKGSISFMRNLMIVSQTRLGFLLLERSRVLR